MLAEYHLKSREDKDLFGSHQHLTDMGMHILFLPEGLKILKFTWHAVAWHERQHAHRQWIWQLTTCRGKGVQ